MLALWTQSAKVLRSFNGILNDGGYAEYMTVSEDAVISIPETNWSAAELAPLMCAGVTVFNALRSSGAGAADVVAVQGIGGLGHLAVQFARKMGCETMQSKVRFRAALVP